jgi:ribosome maturation factor RimP
VGHRPTFYFKMDSSVVGRIWRIAAPLVTEYGMEIVDIDYRREGRGNVLRFYLDRVGGGVTIDELSAMSRRLGDVVEVHDVIPGRYLLEVSSPGLNRRLRQPDHFRRYLGKRVRVRTVERAAGRRSFVGPLRAVQDGGVVIAADDGDQFIAFDNISQANYEPDLPGAPMGRQ